MLARKLVEYTSTRELLYLASELAHYHRIQGTKELEEASNFIADTLKSTASLQVRTLKYSYAEPPTYLSNLVGWWVRGGRVELTKPEHKVLGDFHRASTTVVAHSPPGEFEGRVTYVGAGRLSDFPESVEGIVLTYGRGLHIYLRAVRAGASGIIFFRWEGDENAIPYVGLFPSKEDLKYLKIPALSISRRDALRIIKALGEGHEVMVKGFVDSGFKEPAPVKVVEASVGSGDREVHLIAHYCHPSDTVNDNVSGSSTLLELALALSRFLKERASGESKLGGRLVFVWFPEFYGSFPYIKELTADGRKPLGAINLDMIGEKQELSRSTLNIVRPPIFMFSPLEGLVLKNILSFYPPSKHRVVLSNYMPGSDHDSYLLLDVPSLMLLQWPDTFYHSHLDSIDKLSAETALSIGLAALNSASEALRGNALDEVSRAYSYYAYGLDRLRAIEADEKGEILRAVDYVYCKYVEGVRQLFPEGCPAPDFREPEVELAVTKPVFVDVSYVRRSLSEREYEEFLELLSKQPLKSFLRLLPLYDGMKLDKARLLLMADGKEAVELDELRKVLGFLEKTGIAKLRSEGTY